jgi:hypothetical protein
MNTTLHCPYCGCYAVTVQEIRAGIAGPVVSSEYICRACSSKWQVSTGRYPLPGVDPGLLKSLGWGIFIVLVILLSVLMGAPL